MIRVIFMGTPDIAAVIFERLLKEPYEIVLAVTQPDRPKGRGKELAMSPVKQLALLHDIPVFQPERLRNPEAVAVIEKAKPDLIVVAAFGQILSREILDIPPLGNINVHASLLPKHRGAAPIAYAIMSGDREAGVTTMMMDAGIDTGDMLLQEKTTIGEQETCGELTQRLSETGAGLLL